VNNRETIDIEGLLVRAYREKQIHTLNAGGAIALGLTRPRAPGATFSASDKVDTSSFAARMAAELRELQARLGAAPSGLVDLHDAVLALPDFYVERGAGLDFVVWDEVTAARLGHRIEVAQDKGSATIVAVRPGGGRKRRGELIAIGPVRYLVPVVTSTLLIVQGRYGDRPFVPDLVVSRMRPVYRGASTSPVGHVPEYETPLHAVVEARAAYAVWHAAMGILAQAFASSAEYEVTGPAAPAEPWRSTARVLVGAPVSDLVDDEPAPGVVVLKPKRKRPYVPRKTKENRTVATA